MNPTDQSMPWNGEAEETLLGMVLHEPNAYLPRLRAEVPVEAVYKPEHKEVLRVILALEFEGLPVSPEGVMTRLTGEGILGSKVGQTRVWDLCDRGNVVPAMFGWCRDELREKLGRRTVIERCTQLIELARTFQESGERTWRDLCIETQGELFNLTQEHGQARDFVPVSAVMDEVDAYINDALRNKGHVTHGLATGFTDLDRTLMGLQPGQLFILAARPAMGKSSYAANIAENIALGNGHYVEFKQQPLSVGMVTLEMSAKEIMVRMNLGMGGMDLRRARDGFVNRTTSKNVAEAGDTLRKAPIYILDTGNLTIQELRGLARQAHARHKFSVLIVDYLQLLKSGSKAAKANRYVEVQEVSQGLKALAKELRIPIIAIAQVGRKAEEHKGCRPQMGDLRESGDIENDADIIGLLWREPYYVDCPEGQDEEEWNRRATLIIEKNRNGPPGDLPHFFEGALARFSSSTKHLNANDASKHQGGGGGAGAGASKPGSVKEAVDEEKASEAAERERELYDTPPGDWD